MNSQLIEIASWRIVSELFRRFPGKFHLAETHPGSGMYDCLSLFNNQRHVADFNRVGRFHVFDTPSDQPPLDIWPALVKEDVQGVLDEVCRRLGLKVPAKLPPSTSEIIVYRFISAFLAHSIFGKEKWECRNGYTDSSGMGRCGVCPSFDHFPATKDRMRVLIPTDPFQTPAYRFWFILKNCKPVVCLETTGIAWNNVGLSFDLMALYKKEKRLWPIVWKVAGHLFS